MKPLTIAFITLGLPFTGDTLERKGLGGSETALTNLARSLAARGHRVIVFCNCEQAGQFHGVDYLDVQNFTKMSAITEWDVLIASRWPEFLAKPTQAGLRILWLHDTITDKGRLLNHLWQTDGMFLLSDFHIANYCEGETEEETLQKIPELKKFIWKTSNGIDLKLINENRRPKDENKIFYSSRPERGLHFLLKNIWPKLIEQNPDLRLHYCNYSLGQMQLPEHVQQINAMCESMARSFGDSVVNVGHLSKDRLYQEMSSAKLLLYPTEFPEISCITAMEAAACGTPIVTTDDFALRETVANNRTGYLIKGRPSEDDYISKFLRKTNILLNNPQVYDTFSKAGPEWIEEQGYTWDAVAETWEKRFLEMMEARWKKNSVKVVQELVRRQDLVMARELAVESDGMFSAPIADMIEVAKNGRPQPVSAKEVTDRVRAAVPRFKRVCADLYRLQPKPVHILDFACGHEGFGLAAAQLFPEARITMVDKDPDVCKQIAANVDAAKLTDRIRILNLDLLSEAANKLGPVDVIFLGNYVELQEDPAAVVQEASALLKSGGFVITVTQYGAETATVPDRCERLWNLGQRDWIDIVGDGHEGHLSFVDQDISKGGDLIGHWVCVIPIQEENKLACRKVVPERRRLITRPYQSLAVCMIAKDGEEWLIKCLGSLLPIVDKLVIALDSRTSDHTREIIEWMDKENRVEIRDVVFEDFAQMRNASIDGVEEDWIFWVDTDEMLTDNLKLKRYLQGPMLEGFSVKQAHLMLDVHGTFDIPVRLLRNRPYHRFVGCVHEHCEDVRGGYDNPIAPSMLIPDVTLAHYGYINEKQRRVKCSNRNLALLLKDVEMNGKKGRMLTWVLLMRDYLNHVKWMFEKNQTPALIRGSNPHLQVVACIKTYLEKFKGKKHRYDALAFPMYQEALELLGRSRIPFDGRPTPPFSTALGLSAAMGQKANEAVQAKSVWFLDKEECMDFFDKQIKTMLVRLGTVDAASFKEDLTKPRQLDHDYNETDLLKQLRPAVAAIHETTGQLK